jgi:hypothetical protein
MVFLLASSKGFAKYSSPTPHFRTSEMLLTWVYLLCLFTRFVRIVYASLTPGCLHSFT